MSVDRHPLKPAAAAIAQIEHDALPAGTRFGEFEIMRVLGVGGFGIVYLAQDHSLERQVALKEYMPAALATRRAGAMISVRSASFAETYAMGLRSFINEARLLARFDHPSLVKVYRFWEDNGTAYMVMPYLQGRTLRDARRAMGHAPDEAWIRAVLAPVLDALELLHREGVFHRDIAPDNILLPPDGAPILLDFGAARHVISDRTQSLTAILKPSYAPIEQYAEMAAMRQGPWTDLYALGAVLHYLLFGVPPAPATARTLEPDAEPIGQRVVPGVSPRFMSVVAWMLGVRPLERPQNVASLRAALNGEMPIPASVRREVIVPSEPASMPVAAPRPGFVPTAAEPPFEPTLRVVDSAGTTRTRADTANQPTLPMPSSAAKVATPPMPGSAPLRSTPPGKPPPSYVPPPRPPRLAPADSDASVFPKPLPRRRAIGGALAALVLAAGVLWQFVGVIDRPHPAAPSMTAASAAAGSLPRGGVAARPVAVSPVLPAAIATAAEPLQASAPAADRTRPPQTVAARAADDAPQANGKSPRDAPRPRAASQQPASKLANRVATGPTSAREACGNRNFISQAVCMDRECERPRFRKAAECVRVLEMKQRRVER